MKANYSGVKEQLSALYFTDISILCASKAARDALHYRDKSIGKFTDAYCHYSKEIYDYFQGYGYTDWLDKDMQSRHGISLDTVTAACTTGYKSMVKFVLGCMYHVLIEERHETKERVKEFTKAFLHTMAQTPINSTGRQALANELAKPPYKYECDFGGNYTMRQLDYEEQQQQRRGKTTRKEEVERFRKELEQDG